MSYRIIKLKVNHIPIEDSDGIVPFSIYDSNSSGYFHYHYLLKLDRYMPAINLIRNKGIIPMTLFKSDEQQPDEVYISASLCVKLEHKYITLRLVFLFENQRIEDIIIDDLFVAIDESTQSPNLSLPAKTMIVKFDGVTLVDRRNNANLFK